MTTHAKSRRTQWCCQRQAAGTINAKSAWRTRTRVWFHTPACSRGARAFLGSWHSYLRASASFFFCFSFGSLGLRRFAKNCRECPRFERLTHRENTPNTSKIPRGYYCDSFANAKYTRFIERSVFDVWLADVEQTMLSHHRKNSGQTSIGPQLFDELETPRVQRAFPRFAAQHQRHAECAHKSTSTPIGEEPPSLTD